MSSESWVQRGEKLTPQERAYLDREDVEYGFHDFSSQEVLKAYRAGYNDAAGLSPARG